MELIKCKHSALYALLLRILGLIVGVTAVTLQLFTNSVIGKGFMANHVLAYFTIQTNIFSSLIFLYLIIKTIVIFAKTKKFEVAHMMPLIHLGFTFYITITMTVYWTALAPMLGVGQTGLEISNTLFLHLFTPLMAIIDCLLFIKHNQIKKDECFKLLAYPVVYLLSIIIIANVSDVPYYQFPVNGENIPLMYPYPFLDPQVVTLGGSIGIMLALCVVVVLFGLLYIYIDQLIGRAIKKREDN